MYSNYNSLNKIKQDVSGFIFVTDDYWQNTDLVSGLKKQIL